MLISTLIGIFASHSKALMEAGCTGVTPFDANGYDKTEAARDLACAKQFIAILNTLGTASTFKAVMAILSGHDG